MAKSKLKKRLVVRITAPLIHKVKIAPERDGRPVSGFVRKALTEAVAAEPSGPRFPHC
jgi:predicted DNA binding CopG/RHH family protein